MFPVVFTSFNCNYLCSCTYLTTAAFRMEFCCTVIMTVNRLNSMGALKLQNDSVSEMACALLTYNVEESVVWLYVLAQWKSWPGHGIL